MSGEEPSFPVAVCGFNESRFLSKESTKQIHLDDESECIWPGRTVQIIPATGWRAAFKRNDGTHDLMDVAAWALREDCDGTRTTEGLVAMDTGLEFPTDLKNFDAYFGPNEKLPVAGED